MNSWEKAQEIWTQLDQEGNHQELLKVNTKDIFK
jgi:hypothetical protein